MCLRPLQNVPSGNFTSSRAVTERNVPKSVFGARAELLFWIFLGFTLQAKLVSSKHLIQVHLKISSRTLENLASYLVTKYTLEAQAVNHLSR